MPSNCVRLLTDNYSWSNGKRTPYQFTLSMSAKVVDLPKMFDNYNEGNVFTCTVKLVERSVLELVCGTPYNYVLRNVGFKRGITVCIR